MRATIASLENEIAVSAATFWELAIKLQLGRVEIDLGELQSVDVEPDAVNRDAPALDRAQRMDAGDSGSRHDADGLPMRGPRVCRCLWL